MSQGITSLDEKYNKAAKWLCQEGERIFHDFQKLYEDLWISLNPETAAEVMESEAAKVLTMIQSDVAKSKIIRQIVDVHNYLVFIAALLESQE